MARYVAYDISRTVAVHGAQDATSGQPITLTAYITTPVYHNGHKTSLALLTREISKGECPLGKIDAEGKYGKFEPGTQKPHHCAKYQGKTRGKIKRIFVPKVLVPHLKTLEEILAIPGISQ